MQTATKPQHLDMLNGPIWNKLPRYALPVAATGILGQLFNAADIAVVGNFTGDMRTAAVAAVGANSPVIGLLLNLFIGIALGANVVIANAIGRGDRAQLTREVADDGDVGRVEQLPENAGRRDRKGVARELAPERPVEHVHMPLFGHCLHNFLTFCSKCVKIQRHIIREAQPGIKTKFV